MNILPKISGYRKGVLSLLLLSFVFASMGLFARYLSTGFELFQQVYLRIFAAFMLSFIVFRNDIDLGKLRKISTKEWGLIFARVLTFYVFGVTLFTQAIILTKYSNVSFIGALPMVAIMGVFLLKEKITAKKLALIITAFLGVLLIAVTDYSHIFSWGKGEFIALISTVTFAFSYVARKWHTKLLNNKEITTLMLGLASILLLITSLLFGEGLPLTGWSNGLIVAIIGAGIFNIINLLLSNYGFQKVEAIFASNILTLESVFAIVLGLLFYKEVPIARELAGGAIIALSVIGMNWVEEKE
ncbi:hypothetical protein COY15_03370 [Candidatus Roizmanbacteria bacterium CG_4_10_14_0_2_um_filter_39_12]|nr:MAG: hypothetical protein COY15_03370 [Candidatus Roizmanbacteria bacterium CG_4_10_14_0_2_um_filter_39_12]